MQQVEQNLGGVQGVRTPPGFLIQLVFCKKKICGLLVLK